MFSACPPRDAALPLVLLATLAIGGCGVDRNNPLRPTVSSPGNPGVARSAVESRAITLGRNVPSGTAEGGAAFYPLAIGNSWSYATSFQFTVLDSAGNVLEAFDDAGTSDRSLTGLASIFGRDYVEEDWIDHNSSQPDPIPFAVFYRQDRAGLYEADPPFTSVATMPARPAYAAIGPASRRGAAILKAFHGRVSRDAVDALLARLDHVTGGAFATRSRGGVLDHEITRLSYPLHPGAHWVIRADPRFESTVERFGPIDEPAGRFVGARIRIDSEFFGPRDHVELRYGRDGFLGLSAHLEGIATDEAGNVIGTTVVEQRQDLTALALRKN